MKIGSEPEVLQSVESIPTKTTNRKKRAKEKLKELDPESSDENQNYIPTKESVKSKSAILSESALESTQKRKKKKKRDKNVIQGEKLLSFFFITPQTYNLIFTSQFSHSESSSDKMSRFSDFWKSENFCRIFIVPIKFK